MSANSPPGLANPQTGADAICSKCSHPCQELKFLDCGCYIHASCFPISTIFNLQPVNNGQQQQPSLRCPSCGTICTKGIYLQPLNAATIAQRFTSYPLSINIGSGAYRSHHINGQQRHHHPHIGIDPSDHVSGDEFYASIAPLFSISYSNKSDSMHNSSHHHSSLSSNNNNSTEVQFRNGRWSKEEFDFVECVIKHFNAGCLAILCGTTLNDLLRSLLLCKSTRLRKKIKNANFCTRTYHVNTTYFTSSLSSTPTSTTTTTTTSSFADTSEIWKLQNIFLHSIESEDEKTLLRFNMSRTWTTLFWKFYLDMTNRGSSESSKSSSSTTTTTTVSPPPPPPLLVEDWLNDIEELEQRSMAALDKKKQSERRKRVDSVLPVSNNISGSTAVVVDREQQKSFTIAPITTSTTNVPTTYTMEQQLQQHQQPQHHSMTEFHHPVSPIPMPVVSSLAPQPIVEDFDLGSTAAIGMTNAVNESTIMSSLEYDLTQNNNNTNDIGEIATDDVVVEAAQSSSSGGGADSTTIGQKRERPSTFISEKPESITDIADICHQFADWKPFIDKISSFMENAELPFEYFDVWIAEEVKEEEEVDEGGSNNNNETSTTLVRTNAGGGKNIPQLRHVGHGIRSDTESIFTLYHMNEFGKYSSNFMFPPGVGLPGRVFTSGQPLWDDSVQDLTWNQFPRSSGAKIHGVKKALGIPVSNNSGGRIVIGMYCSEEIAKDDGMVQRCCIELQAYNPAPKWELSIEVGEDNDDLEDCGDIMGLPQIKNEADMTEEKIVRLLGKCTPLVSNSSPENNQMMQSIVSLRLKLLKSTSLRTQDEVAAIETLKRSYTCYCKTNRTESDLAMLLANDWMMLSQLHATPIDIHHRNYGDT